jgi:hypothetical protein
VSKKLDYTAYCVFPENNAVISANVNEPFDCLMITFLTIPKSLAHGKNNTWNLRVALNRFGRKLPQVQNSTT